MLTGKWGEKTVHLTYAILFTAIGGLQIKIHGFVLTVTDKPRPQHLTSRCDRLKDGCRLHMP